MTHRLRTIAGIVVTAVSACTACAVGAQPLAPAPVPPDARLEQRLDAPLPLALTLTDSAAHRQPLGAAFGDRPVLLVFGYYRCPQLCGLLMHGLLEALQHSGLSRTDYRIVRVSLDPAETPADALARRSAELAYASFLAADAPAAKQQPALDLRLLTGDEASLRTLARSAGVHYQRTAFADDPAARFAHAAAVIVVSPEGRISSYQTGVQFDPAALRSAVVDAGHGRIGSFTDRIALMCAHVDPRLGRYSGAVLWGLRSACLLLVGGLAAWLWRHRGLPRRSEGAVR
ncbi:SCO family protein [Rhizobacter fulvus]